MRDLGDKSYSCTVNLFKQSTILYKLQYSFNDFGANKAVKPSGLGDLSPSLENKALVTSAEVNSASNKDMIIRKHKAKSNNSFTYTSSTRVNRTQQICIVHHKCRSYLPRVRNRITFLNNQKRDPTTPPCVLNISMEILTIMIHIHAPRCTSLLPNKLILLN
ncbi:hypothetical protein Droror1_Dr00018204 [Drosera rotundifolia]